MDNKNKQLNYWLDDLRSLKTRVAQADVQFESISHYLIKIMNDSNMQNGMTVQKKRCIEKMQAYRSNLLILMTEIRLFNHTLRESLPKDQRKDEESILSVPPQPSNWYWSGNTYDGIQHLTSLLSRLGNFSDQLNKILNSMSRICKAVSGNNNNPKQEKS